MFYKESTVKRMQDACVTVERGRAPYVTFIEACAHVADDMVAEVEDARSLDLPALTARMRANSERWFPDLHNHPTMRLDVFYALGLSGEVGEVANVVKKMVRDGFDSDRAQDLASELADVFVYLCLLAGELGVDLLTEYVAKVDVNDRRWG